MLFNKKILGLIPARSGSKGIKNKNMQKLGNKSLIAHSVLFVNSLKYLDCKLITTDSNIYIKEAQKFGLDNFLLRSKKLSNDNASIIDVISNAINYVEKENKIKYDYLLLCEPTSPFRIKSDIINCIKIAIKNKAYSVFTVSKLDSKFHPIKILKKHNGKIRYFSKEGRSIINKQDIITDYFYRNGLCYVIDIKLFKKQKKIISNNSFSYFINREIADIDTRSDLLWSRYLYEKNYQK
mgnify:CR=1 FL=1|tara:strand:- start:330 stop:1043 length:714 start_codon:yes stop_codon:yes gene_type:complete